LLFESRRGLAGKSTCSEVWVIKTPSVEEIVMRESTDSSWSLQSRWANDR
jgi:hypothetical protein